MGDVCAVGIGLMIRASVASVGHAVSTGAKTWIWARQIQVLRPRLEMSTARAYETDPLHSPFSEFEAERLRMALCEGGEQDLANRLIWYEQVQSWAFLGIMSLDQMRTVNRAADLVRPGYVCFGAGWFE